MLTDEPPFEIQILLFSEFISLFLYLPFIYLFFKNRNILPIRPRLPLFVLALDFTVYCMACHEVLASMYPNIYLCIPRQYLGLIPYMSALTIYNYRLLHLFFAHKIADNVKKNINLAEWTENWYIRHRNFVRPEMAVRFLVITTLLYMLFLFLLIVLDPTAWTQGCNFKSIHQRIFRLGLLINEAIGFTISGILGCVLRRVHGDAFWIKSEFMVTVYTSGLAFVIYAMLTAFSYPRWLPAIFVFWALHCILFSGTFWPYLLSRREKLAAEIDNFSDSRTKISDGPELIDVLKRSEGFQAFLAYLETEFSSENLFFWNSVEQLRNLDPEDPSTPEQVGRIYFQYCDENAPCQVNLSPQIRMNILQYLQNLKHHSELTSWERAEVLTVFDAAQRDIYNLMTHDAYPRFRRSPYCNRGTFRVSELEASKTQELTSGTHELISRTQELTSRTQELKTNPSNSSSVVLDGDRDRETMILEGERENMLLEGSEREVAKKVIN